MIFIWAAIFLVALAVTIAGLRRAGVSLSLSSINLGGVNHLVSNRWVRVIVGIIVAVSFISYFWSELGSLASDVNLGNFDAIFSFGLLIVLAILALMGKGGWATRIALAVVILGLLILGPTGLFGTHSNVQNSIKEVMLEGKPILPASGPQSPAADAASVENVVPLALNQCTEPVMVRNDQCITRRDEVPGKSTFRSEVFNISTQGWEKLPAGAFRNARYWRFCGTEEGAKVFYSVYQRPQGGCSITR